MMQQLKQKPRQQTTTNDHLVTTAICICNRLPGILNASNSREPSVKHIYKNRENIASECHKGSLFPLKHEQTSAASKLKSKPAMIQMKTFYHVMNHPWQVMSSSDPECAGKCTSCRMGRVWRGFVSTENI